MYQLVHLLPQYKVLMMRNWERGWTGGETYTGTLYFTFSFSINLKISLLIKKKKAMLLLLDILIPTF